MTGKMSTARLQNVILFVLGIFWQVYILINIGRHRKDILAIPGELGAAVPAITQWFIAALPYLWTVPLVCIILFVMVLLRAKNELTPFNIAINAVVVGMLLHAWMIEAYISPFLDLSGAID